MNYKKTSFIFICSFLILIFWVNLFGQNDKNPVDKTDASSSVVKNDEKNKTETRIESKKVGSKALSKKDKIEVLQKDKKKANPVIESVKPGVGLLMIKDGDYKYKRIPEIELDKKEVEEEEIVEISDSEKAVIKTEKKESDEKGLFGLSKKTADIIAKGSLVVLILLIFVLYKFRSKKTDRRVLRSLPKK